MIDWEAKIIEVCEQLEIDPEVYNNDNDAKEVVAKLLGFSSFACFVALPEPMAIVDGRGTFLLKGHKMQQLSLGEGCIHLIKVHYQISRDEIDLEREINRFVKYLEENFDDEFAIVSLMTLLLEMVDIYDVTQFASIKKYEAPLEKMAEMIDG